MLLICFYKGCPSISDSKMRGSGIYDVEKGSYEFTF